MSLCGKMCIGKLKRQEDPSDMYAYLADLEETAQKKQAESDEKQLKLLAELHQKTWSVL